MSIESKTPFPMSPEGLIAYPNGIRFPPDNSVPLDQTAIDTIEKKMNALIRENERLRIEINALHQIIKNINN
jgi:hypothetical protein